MTFAQKTGIPSIYGPGKCPGEMGAKQESRRYKPTIPSGTGHHGSRYHQSPPPALYSNRRKPYKNGAAVIVCPGGGYNILAIDKEGYEVAEWLNTLGYTAFVLQYRVPNKQQEALYDLQRSIRMVRTKAAWEKLGIIGFSAGGSLGARAGTRFKEDTYDKIDEMDEASSRPDFCHADLPRSTWTGETTEA